MLYAPGSKKHLERSVPRMQSGKCDPRRPCRRCHVAHPGRLGRPIPCVLSREIATSIPGTRTEQPRLSFILKSLLRRAAPRSLNPQMQQLLRALQLMPPSRAQVFPGAVYIEGQHPHAGGRPLRRNLLRRKAARNRRRIFLEQPFLGYVDSVSTAADHFRRP